MEIVIILLYVFLIIIGIVSIIGSLISLSNRLSESDSSLETKLFKWRAPVRLVFGLLCILSVIFINKFDFYSIDKDQIASLEKQVEGLSRENLFLKEKLNSKDSIQNYYIMSIHNNTGISVLQGQVLISNYYRTLTIKGAATLNENYQQINEKFTVETGQKYFIKLGEDLWGLNVLESNINSNLIKIEVYSINNVLDQKHN